MLTIRFDSSNLAKEAVNAAAFFKRAALVILPAVEKRIRANVLYVAGFCFQRALPEVDQVNYVGRVTQPTLMLNGELDFFFPAATSQEPMFEMLGTPPALKKRLTYPRGHTVPRLDFMRESLAWLDEHLGRAD